MIFYNAAFDEHAAGAEALSTSPGSLAAVFLVTHFEKRQDGRWRKEKALESHTHILPPPLASGHPLG